MAEEKYREEENEEYTGDSGEEEAEGFGEMSFFDHLEDMRKRIIYSVISVLIGCIIAGIFINFLMDYILLQPAASANLNLQNLKPFGLPFLYFKVIFVIGFIIGFPLVLYQLWKFIEPGLYDTEKKWASKITAFTSFCFMGGVFFAYFVMLPSMLDFAASFGTKDIRNDIDVNQYFSFITMIMLAAGLLFEMPVVSFILARVGIISPKLMRRYWRHAIIGILILAAVLTPTPDPVSQLIFAAPLFLLYEISIIVARIGQKKQDATD